MIAVDIKKRLGECLLHAEFEASEAQIVALHGRSGASKTSIINMVASLIQPDEGRIVVNGRCVFDSETGVNLAPERRRFGYIFQDGRLFPHICVKANLVYGMKLLPAGARHVCFDEVVDVLGIRRLLNRYPGKLSGGEKQRVAIGRALLTSPDLLLMDEPMASLDEARKQELLPFIAELPTAFGIPILFVSHSLVELRAISNRIVFLESREHGRFDEVKTAPACVNIADLRA